MLAFSLGSNQTLFLPHFMTEAASLFWRMRELIFDYWPTRIYLLKYLYIRYDSVCVFLVGSSSSVVENMCETMNNKELGGILLELD